ncbi:hypothetical protein DL93DRAFT_2077241 [Clavulina sp. PMI_390]|nr:hypothetical protein DL93DRAFT_2077241 [Clavulina sp. PMI_390]
MLQVKQILWTTWPEEWAEERPPAPAFLRLLHLGRMWTDELRLADMTLSASSIVHLSIRPFVQAGENDRGSSSKRRKSKRLSVAASDAPVAGTSRGAEPEDNGGCCCIIS